jgi:signal transduction histidine kinase/putative methionine-R-sulfoxide reductase with GAF domain
MTYPVQAEPHGRDRAAEAEQAALRRVATLVAEGVAPAELFATVVEEVGRVLARPAVVLDRYEPDGVTTVVACTNVPGFPVGSRWPLDGPSLAATVLETGRAARIDDYESLEGTIAGAIRAGGFRSSVGVPIVVEGAVWGILCVGTTHDEPLPANAGDRLRDFTELIAIAISNAESRDRLRRLAEQQTSLRRVATLVAEGATPTELFSAVAEEVARIVDVALVSIVRYEADRTAVVLASLNALEFPVGSRWPLDGPSLFATVFETGRPARIDDYSELAGSVAAAARASGVQSGLGVPIIVDGRVWGMVAVGRRQRREALPVFAGSYSSRIVFSTESTADVEARLAAFTDLVATAIANADSRDGLRLLADEQATLRRVATLVARGVSRDELLTAVAREVAGLPGVELVAMSRFEPEATRTLVASWGDPELAQRVGRRWPLDESPSSSRILATGRPLRVDLAADQVRHGPAAGLGVRSYVGSPIEVEGRIWGALFAMARGSLPADTERRLTNFTELVATAIANSEARDALRLLADEQAALRRVATLVARGTDSQAIFDAVCAEACRLIDATSVNLSQYTSDGFNLMIAGWSFSGTHLAVGTRLALAPDTIRSAVAAPVVVEGEVWGELIAGSDSDEPLAAGAEQRLARFTELIATAISNATARGELIASRARIVAAGDEARRRFERNLHDGTQQQLLALRLDLQRIRSTIPESDPAARSGLEEAERTLESVLEEVREVSRGLHPSQLARGGLGPSLRTLAARSPIETDVDVRLEERPPQQIETAVYYVVSEALANAIKHSDAAKIGVVVTGNEHVLAATIADDGVGGAAMEAGSGLMGLNDRVEALGGRFVIASPQGGGTTISIELPISTPAAP